MAHVHVALELFLFLQEQIKGIIIITSRVSASAQRESLPRRPFKLYRVRRPPRHVGAPPRSVVYNYVQREREDFTDYDAYLECLHVCQNLGWVGDDGVL